MSAIIDGEPGSRHLLMGNEAIARGALEAGVAVVAGYPGTPSSEIIETLAGVSARQNLYVEWSVMRKWPWKLRRLDLLPGCGPCVS